MGVCAWTIVKSCILTGFEAAGLPVARSVEEPKLSRVSWPHWFAPTKITAELDMRRTNPIALLGGCLVATFLLSARPSQASNPYLEVPAEHEMLRSPAYRYANASNEQVLKWISERRIPFVTLTESKPGVRLPGRLTGALHGVSIHGTDLQHIADSPYEILDGRLALALDDFCEVLAGHGFVELLHLTMFRPNRSATKPLTRHPGALAIDLSALKRSDGTWLRVKRDFRPAIGAKTCGLGALQTPSEGGRLLQRALCEARQRGIFHYALTPHFNATHADHFHLEIKPEVKWFLYE